MGAAWVGQVIGVRSSVCVCVCVPVRHVRDEGERTGDTKPPGITMSTIAVSEQSVAKTLMASASRVEPLVSTGTVNCKSAAETTRLALPEMSIVRAALTEAAVPGAGKSELWARCIAGSVRDG